jgi:hypothetical protein
MQAILATGDADFNPAFWLSPASAVEASSSYRGPGTEDGVQCPASKSSSNGTSTANFSFEGDTSILGGSVLQGAGPVASELTALTGNRSVADASLTSLSGGGCPFSAMSFKHKEANATKKLVFGVGPRSCVGLNLAVAELVVFLIVLARKVKEVKMSVKDQERKVTPVLRHPTGLPACFIPRNS